MVEQEDRSWLDYANMMPPANRDHALAFHLRLCVHEAGHAMAGYGAGVVVDRIRVMTLLDVFGESTQTAAEGIGAASIADERLEKNIRIAIFMAGYAAEGDESIEAIARRAWHENEDISRATQLALELIGDDEDRVAEAGELLQNTLTVTRAWLREAPQQRALDAIVVALIVAAETTGILSRREFEDLCREHAPDATRTFPLFTKGSEDAQHSKR